MQDLRLLADVARTVLFVGAHCDDIEIGCGGTLQRLRRLRPDLDVRFVILTGNELRRREALASANRFIGPEAGDRVLFESFRDGFLPYRGSDVKSFFERLKRDIRPDVIFTHHREDRHQDHRLVSELTWNTWRDHLIFEYEIPKYDGELGQPNAFVALTGEEVERKTKILLECYPSQTSREWFDADTLRAIMRLRGIESNAPDRYAEGFHVRKLLVGL